MLPKKPSLGAQIWEEWQNGLNVNAIAKKLGTSPEYCRSAISRANRRLGKPPAEKLHFLTPAEPRPNQAQRLHLPKRLVIKLQPHATRRNLTVSQLSRKLLSIAVQDNLIDGILDDETT